MIGDSTRKGAKDFHRSAENGTTTTSFHRLSQPDKVQGFAILVKPRWQGSDCWSYGSFPFRSCCRVNGYDNHGTVMLRARRHFVHHFLHLETHLHLGKMLTHGCSRYSKIIFQKRYFVSSSFVKLRLCTSNEIHNLYRLNLEQGYPVFASAFLCSKRPTTLDGFDPPLSRHTFAGSLVEAPDQGTLHLSHQHAWSFNRGLPKWKGHDLLNMTQKGGERYQIIWLFFDMFQFVFTCCFFKDYMLHYSLLYFIFATTLPKRKKKLLNKCSGLKGVHSVPNLIIQKNIVFPQTWQNGAPIW